MKRNKKEGETEEGDIPVMEIGGYKIMSDPRNVITKSPGKKYRYYRSLREAVENLRADRQLDGLRDIGDGDIVSKLKEIDEFFKNDLDKALKDNNIFGDMDREELYARVKAVKEENKKD